jgi:hypothetical protein
MGLFVAPCRTSLFYRVPQFGDLIAVAFASALFAQAAMAADNSSPDSKTWTGFGWGLGIAADFDLAGKRVSAVTLDNANIVRVTDTSGNVGVSFVLEAHYFPFEWPTGMQYCSNPNLSFRCNDIATGPFVAVEIGGGTAANTNAGPITGYALGWMVGLHHPKLDAAGKPVADSTSWNFGVGLRVDPSAKVLADGVVANRPPPAGITTTDLLTKKEPRYGIMLLSSFSF